MVAPQIMDIAPVIALLATVVLVAVGLAGIARLVALAETIIVLLQPPLEALERVALVEVLVVVVVVLGNTTTLYTTNCIQEPQADMAEASALRGLVRAARAGQVACTIPLTVEMAQADRLEQLRQHSLLQGLMAVVQVAETMDILGSLRVIPVGQLIPVGTSQPAALAQFVSCGAVVDPILLTQRTYNR
jgi:hypothetical protein